MKFLTCSILILSLVSCSNLGKKNSRGKSIKDTFLISSADVKRCYDNFMERGNKVDVNIKLELDVNDLGFVTKVSNKTKQSLENKFYNCLRETLFSYQFPKSTKGLTLIQPYRFHVKK